MFKYDPKFADEVVEVGRQGGSRVQMAARIGVPLSVFNSFLKKKNFALAVELADTYAQAYLEQKGISALDIQGFNTALYSKIIDGRATSQIDIDTIAKEIGERIFYDT